MDVDAIRDRVGTLVAVGLIGLLVGAFGFENGLGLVGVVGVVVGAGALLLAAVGWLFSGSR